MNETTHLRRAMLFMPGDSLRKIEKAIGLGVDSIVMDLEDGVAFNQKAEARRTVFEARAGALRRLSQRWPMAARFPRR